jgi:hypothetical protein
VFLQVQVSAFSFGRKTGGLLAGKGKIRLNLPVTPEISVLERIMLKWSGGPCIDGQGQAAIAGLPSCSAGKASVIMHKATFTQSTFHIKHSS